MPYQGYPGKYLGLKSPAPFEFPASLVGHTVAMVGNSSGQAVAGSAHHD